MDWDRSCCYYDGRKRPGGGDFHEYSPWWKGWGRCEKACNTFNEQKSEDRRSKNACGASQQGASLRVPRVSLKKAETCDAHDETAP